MKKNFYLFLALIAGVTFISCDKNNEIETKQVGAYALVGSSTTASYVLQSNQLDTGVVSIKNNGIEAAAATVWWFHGDKYLYRLVYNQGNAGTGTSFAVDSTGSIYQRNIGFEITSRFTTYGNYGDYIILGAAGATAQKDNAGNAQYGVTFTYLNTKEQTLTTKTVSTENYLGTGEYVTFSGIVESAGKIYTGVCPVGFSAYGVAKGYAQATSTKTIYNDSVWVAVYNSESMENPTVLRDNRLSYSTSRYNSQYYSNIALTDKGDIYVFSSRTDTLLSTKPSGVIRIKKGATAFDKDFYINIEALSGGLRMYKAWHITGDYFALQMYTTRTSANSDTRNLAILNVASKTLSFVSGLPDMAIRGAFAKTPFVENGKFHIPVPTTDGSSYPAIYVVNPVTATALKGITMKDATTLDAVGKLTYYK